eukprot:SAG31_NODE_554_length_14181_cov_22.378000_5_plen_37_part_00
MHGMIRVTSYSYDSSRRYLVTYFFFKNQLLKIRSTY